MIISIFIYLSLSVDTNDSTGGLMDSRDKDGLSTDAVHVDTGASLNVVQVDVAKLGDQVDDIILLTHLYAWALIRINTTFSITLYRYMDNYTSIVS